MKLFLMDLYRVGLRKHFVTYFTLEGPLLGVAAHVHIALGGSPEALAALGTRIRFRTGMNSFVDIL